MRYAEVLINTRSAEIGGFFTYSVPESLDRQIKVGQLVLVPFRSQHLQGVVAELHRRTPKVKTRPVYGILDNKPLVDPLRFDLAKYIADAFLAPLAAAVMLMLPAKSDFKTASWIELADRSAVANRLPELARAKSKLKVVEFLLAQPNAVSKTELIRQLKVGDTVIRQLETAGIIQTTHKIVWREQHALPSFASDTPPELNGEQLRAVTSINQNPGGKFLLHGVTGSGKTEVYLQAAKAVLAAGKNVIVLVPEISITPQTVARFANRFPNLVTVFHSGLSAGERFDAWHQIEQGIKRIVIGPRSALFTPMQNLGLIVIDEEHDDSFKQDSTPRYDARLVANKLAELTQATLIFGSATPSFERYTAALHKELNLVELTQPAYPSLPPKTYIVDMRNELRSGNKSVLSELLVLGIKQVLAKHKQALLFLNRRGSATTVLCRDCGYVLNCENCNLPMIYHRTDKHEYVKCHHCERSIFPPDRCPDCGGLNFKYLGAGTEKIEEEVKRMFPQARVLRMDRDTTTSKDAFARIYQALINKEVDIVIGTQMIAKGWDLPDLDLVGIVLADPGLFWPDFRTNERNLQLLSQVVGRTSRREHPGVVILQTYNPDNEVIRKAIKQDYQGLYQQEIDLRKELKYPPFAKVIQLTFADEDMDKAQTATEKLANQLAKSFPDVTIDWSMSFFSKLAGKYRFQITLRSLAWPVELLAQLRTLRSPWQVDVDPVSVL